MDLRDFSNLEVKAYRYLDRLTPEEIFLKYREIEEKQRWLIVGYLNGLGRNKKTRVEEMLGFSVD